MFFILYFILQESAIFI